jgi:hypothetical protein
MKRVLFDEDVPKPLRNEFSGIEIVTVVEAGWAGVKNGELLRLAEQSFEVFVTADRNLPFQQNVARLLMGVVVLAIGSTKLADRRDRADDISDAIERVAPGELIWIEPPSNEPS